jgi:multicomponent Na+:H+ antiporter subunit F
MFWDTIKKTFTVKTIKSLYYLLLLFFYFCYKIIESGWVVALLILKGSRGEHGGMLEYASVAGLWIMTISLAFPLWRLFKGPSLPDRVVALDQIAVIIVGIIICDIIYSKNELEVDVVLIVSFLLAMGSMIIARFLYKQNAEK